MFYFLVSPTDQRRLIMKKNVGGVDRMLRIVVGLVLMALAATDVVGPWGWLGVIVLATGVFSFCGAYTLLGINTCPTQKPNP
jgi:hypothetical protein